MINSPIPIPISSYYFEKCLLQDREHNMLHGECQMSVPRGKKFHFDFRVSRNKNCHIREFRAKGNPFTFPLTFPLVLREKLREFPSQILFGLR